MGRRGPLKLPAHLRPVSDQSSTVADRVTPLAPDRPPGFPVGHELGVLWDALVPRLDDAGLLATCDGLVVELALRHFVAARRASDALASGDVVVADAAHAGQKKNPAGAEFRAQSELFRRYALTLGMSYAARSRIPSAPGASEGNNLFADPALPS